MPKNLGLVSVVVPLYNNANFIKRCLDSLAEQTYSYIEVLIINDGSNDNSSRKCERFIEMGHKNFFLINQKNRGVSNARNTGIKKANGKYLTFVDADDFVLKNYVEELVRGITSENADMSILGFNYMNEKRSVIFASKGPSKIYKKKVEAMEDTFGKKGFLGVVWGKLFVSTIIKNSNLLFDETIRIYEDHLFCINYMQKISKIVYRNQKLYMYMEHENSAVHKKVEYEDARAYIMMLNETKDLKLRRMINLTVISIFVKAYPNVTQSETQAKMRRLIKSNLFNFIFDKEYSVRLKLLAIVELLISKNILKFLLKKFSY